MSFHKDTKDQSMNENDLWLLAIGLFVAGYIFLRHIKHQKEKEIVTSEREELISKPIPDFVRRSMADYQAGAFLVKISHHSPLLATRQERQQTWRKPIAAND